MKGFWKNVLAGTIILALLVMPCAAFADRLEQKGEVNLNGNWHFWKSAAVKQGIRHGVVYNASTVNIGPSTPGDVFTNVGSTGTMSHVLPKITPSINGQEFTFFKWAEQDYFLDCDDDDRIVVGSTLYGGRLKADTRSSLIRLMAINLSSGYGNWVVTYESGWDKN